MYRFRRQYRSFAGLTLSLVLVCVVCSRASAQPNPTDVFSALAAAPVDTDLPAGLAESGTARTGALRPVLDYPTLRLDQREPRQAQQPEAIPMPLEAGADTGESDFQRLVRQTLGRGLPSFGHELFSANPRGFAPIEQANVPADFILGPGDEVYIRAWGSVDIDYRATIDRGGAITLPKVGEIALAGVRFGDLREHLRAVIERSFHGFELSVSLGQLRSIRVYVTGFAKSPGSYTVNSLSTLVNVLFHAGGPDRAGDLRRIELKRSGELIATVDFYAFLMHGVHDNDLRLLPEDVIHIPALSGEVAIAGSVNRPGIYQLLDNDRLADLIAYAGELSVTASTHRVILERIGADNDRVLEDLPLTEAAARMPLRNGDLVLIQPVSPQFLNAVTLRGHVAQPLRHEWHPDMRVSDLLPSSEALISPRYWVARNEKSQMVRLLTEAPNTDMDIDFPDINWEYALIERIDPATMSTTLLPFNLGKAIRDHDPSHDLQLQPGDQLTVFSLDDFRTRSAQQPRFVRIEGEVLRAGIYPASPQDTIADLIARAGGVTPDAYLYGLELKRESVRRQQKLRIDEALDQLEQDYQRHLINRSRNVLTGDLSLAITPEAAAIDGLIGRLRAAEPSGRIILDLDGAISSPRDLPALKLADGDTIYVPPTPQTIEVVGAVFRQGSFVYGDQSLNAYLPKAGLLPTADERRMHVIRPDGSFSLATNRLRLEPGDTIIVPEQVDRQSAVRRIKDWTQVLYQLGLGAAGLNLLDVF
jgi:protein involved in polysaccharide export with SLBB domain